MGDGDNVSAAGAKGPPVGRLMLRPSGSDGRGKGLNILAGKLKRQEEATWGAGTKEHIATPGIASIETNNVP